MQWRWCVLLQDCRVRKGKSGRFGLAISCVEMSLVREKCYMLVVFFGGNSEEEFFSSPAQMEQPRCSHQDLNSGGEFSSQ
jgi:hypothetical protein